MKIIDKLIAKGDLWRGKNNGGTPIRYLDPLAALQRAEQLEANQQYIGAIRLLTRCNFFNPNVEIEKRLIDLRFKAFCSMNKSLSATQWPPGIPENLEIIDRNVENGRCNIRPEQLSAAALRYGIFKHGCVVVKGKVSEQRA